MHIPDGQLDPATLTVAATASAGAVVIAARSFTAGHKRVGLALFGGAGVLIAHLADVPLYGSFTGHLVGGTLLAIAVGPSLALITMTLALAFEAVVLGDGGVFALGANVLTMGVVGVFVGYGVYRGTLEAARRWKSGDAGLGTAVLGTATSDVVPATAAGDRVPAAAPSDGAPAAATSDLARVIASAVAAFTSFAASTVVLVVLYAVGSDAIRGEAGEALPELVGHYAAWAVLEAAMTAAIFGAVLAWRRRVAAARAAQSEAELRARERVVVG